MGRWVARLEVVLFAVSTACGIHFAETSDAGSDAASAADGTSPDGGSGGGVPCLEDGGVVDQCPMAGLTCCSGTCTSVLTDPQNCGECDAACTGLNDVCRAGACQ